MNTTTETTRSYQNVTEENKTQTEDKISFIFYSATIIAMNAVFFGMHISIMQLIGSSIAEIGIEKLQVDLIAPILYVGGFFGNFLPSILTYRYKIHMAVVFIIYTIGHSLISLGIYLPGQGLLSSKYALFVIIIGRFITGIAVGNGCVIVPQYLFKIAPDSLKGVVGYFNGTGIVCGTLTSQFMNFIIPPATKIMAFHSIILIYFLVLISLIPIKDVPAPSTTDKTSKRKEKSFLELLKDRKTYLSLSIAIILTTSQHASGLGSLSMFTNEILKANFPDNPQKATLSVGCVNFIFNAIGMILVNKMTRKTLLMTSMLGCVFALIFLSTGECDILALFIYFGMFSIGVRPVVWLITPELFPEEYRSKGVMIAVSFYWISAMFFSIIHPFLFKDFQNNTFIFNCYFICFFMIFIGSCLTDTKDRIGQLQTL